MIIANREVNIYPARESGCPLVLFNAFENEGAAVHTELMKLTTADFSLATINITDWNTDLSPWEIPPVYKNDEPFTGGAYLSLGDKESRTRNQVMATVEQNTAALFDYYKSLGVEAVFEMNPGNHFQNVAQRTAKGIVWLITN